MKDVQATGEAFSPQKRTSSILKHEISSLFCIFMGHFCPTEPESGSAFRIQRTKFNADPFGSGSSTLATSKESGTRKVVIVLAILILRLIKEIQ
jgi:hypothetical protein